MTTPQSTTTALALPSPLSPDALDALTELSSILSRLRTPSTLAATATGATPAATPSQSQSQNPNGELSLKEIPTATDNLKHKLQRARALIKTLPDISQGTAQQEAEIAELEAKIQRQREAIENLRKQGALFAGLEGRMEE